MHMDPTCALRRLCPVHRPLTWGSDSALLPCAPAATSCCGFSRPPVLGQLYSSFRRGLITESICRELEAQPAGERGALWGVPFAVKDNIDALPHPTTAACDAFRYTPQSSAATVAALESEGACI